MTLPNFLRGGAGLVIAAPPAAIRAYARAAALQNPAVVTEDSRKFSLGKPLPPSANRLKEVR